ncbi:hypothetical protein BCR43DRAFT_476870 [Syncephalastrum racemosum]|uniref:GRAM domain-containing protein n=1 Tax=Syncephalastrum racemosum TaxID=13706 RepID=A0A1X2H8R2_SYNRA|nr:hypothetical protein BCR43DRAFT_476870 [Syncephalastrum racemosum]
MSFNWAMLTPAGDAPLPLPNEKFLLSQHGVHAKLDCSVSDGRMARDEYNSMGTVYLSNQRIVFVAKDQHNSVMRSLSIPFSQYKNWRLEQPWFTANYITATVLPVPGGGMPKPGPLTLTFREGGAIDFANTYRNLQERYGEYSGVPPHHEPLPAYQPPADSNIASADSHNSSAGAPPPY